MSTFQLSTDDIISYLQTELDKVGFSENHRNELFNSIIENKIDGMVIEIFENVGDLIMMLPGIPTGHVLKAFTILKKLKSKKVEHGKNVVTHPIITDAFNPVSADIALIAKSGESSTVNDTDNISLQSKLSENSALSDADTVNVLLEDSSSIKEYQKSESDEERDSSECDYVPNLISTRPIPKEFPTDKWVFGFHANEIIRTGKLTELGKREIVTELVRSMQRYESHPGRYLRRITVAAFIQKGKAKLGLSRDEARQFWLKKVSEKINTIAKQQRRFSQSTKNGSKRSHNNISGTADTQTVKRKKLEVPIGATSSSDVNHDMEQKQKALQDQYRKPATERSKMIIKELMQDTFAVRQNFVKSTAPKPKDIIAEWPALFQYVEIVRELRRIVSFPSESELTYKAKILFEEVITFARKKSHKSQQLICILQKVQDNDVHELTLNEVIAYGVMILCQLLRSNTKKAISSERYIIDVLPVNACATETVHDRLHPFISIYGELLQPRKIALVCEDSQVLEVSNLCEGLLALFAIYYSLNYEYCAHVKKPLQFLQNYWLSITTPKVCQSVKELALYLNMH